MAHAEPVPWTRQHRLVALNLYSKLPFGQLHKTNPVIKQVAKQMGRTANSLAIKLCNFAHLDPILRERGIIGMKGVTKADRLIWQEFQENHDALALDSEEELRKLFTTQQQDVEIVKEVGVEFTTPSNEETSARAEVNVRLGQNYFRQVILNAFNNRCCVSGIPIRSMLIASHILPWSEHPKERLNPANGLCLSRIHDIAFDRKLITFDEDYRLVLSKALKDECSNAVLKESFSAFEGKPINLPEDTIPPNKEFLAHHRSTFAG